MDRTAELAPSALSERNAPQGQDLLDSGDGALASHRPWRPLGIAAKLLSALDANGVTYCHWKSSNKLRAGLSGERGVDLDLLVDLRDRAKVHRVVSELGFVAKHAGAELFCPGRQGFVGLDHETGRQIYIDMVFTMITGPKRFRPYVLPYAHEFLRDRRRCDTTGIYVPCPVHELILLFLRSALKIDGRAYIKALLGRRHFSDDWTTQLRTLRGGTTLEEVRAQAEDWCNHEVAAAMVRAIESQGAFRDLVRLRQRLSPFRREWMAYSRGHAAALVMFTKLARQARDVNAMLGRYLFPVVHQSPAGGGLFVVVIGPDTSGKSTLTKVLRDTLAWKFNVERVYLGAGDGPSSLLRRALMMIQRRGSPHVRRYAPADGDGEASRPRRSLVRVGKDLYRILYALALAREKQVKLARAWRARHQGVIVVADRCPQSDVIGYNDGPLLDMYRNDKNALLRRLATWEARVYRSMWHRPPDLVIRLSVTPDVALRRDPGLTAERIERRIGAVSAIRFPSTVDIVDIDGTLDLAEVRRRATIAIWQRL